MSTQLNLLGATLNSSTSVADFNNFSKVKISASNDSDAAARNDSVNTKISSAISNEASRATNVEEGLQYQITQLYNNLGYQTTNLQSAISSEVSRASGVEGGLQQQTGYLQQQITQLQQQIIQLQQQITQLQQRY